MDRPSSWQLLHPGPTPEPVRAPPAAALIPLLRASIERHADRVALEGSDWILAYRDLDRESMRLAGVLRSAGVARGSIVPMLMGRSPRFIVAMLALLRCGAAYAPIDTASPPARQAAMLDQLDSPVVLVDGEVDASVVRSLRCIDVCAEIRRQHAIDGPPWTDVPASEPLYVMFTSGSTGVPKGVIVPHGGVARLVHDTDYAAFDLDSRWAQLASVAFDASTLEIWAPLLNGGCCVIQETALPSVADLARFIADRNITDAWLTAALFNAVVDDQIDALGGLRQLATGGERVSPRHVRRCLERWPRLRIINGYGPTENTTFSTCHTVSADDLDSAGELPIGQPIRGTTARVMRVAAEAADLAVECIRGEPGELWVGGAGVAIGYLGDAQLTERKFISCDGDRWYRTGDIVRQRETGVIEFIGRGDRQVKLHGHRIELDEVERTLQSCPGVRDAVVAFLASDTAEGHLAAVYTCLAGQETSPIHVRAWLGARLAPAAVPVSLHLRESLPLNLNGKIDRGDLVEALNPPPASPGPAVEPWHSAIEAQLAAIWQRHLPAARLDRGSHFLQSGGTSLGALRVAADIGRVLERHIEPIDVLRHPVLSDLARVVESARRAKPEPATRPAAGVGAAGVRLSRSQEAIILASKLDASGTAYLTHVALVLDGTASEQRLRDAFSQLAARHPMLRTTVRVFADRAEPGLLPDLPADCWEHLGALHAAPTAKRWEASLLSRINRPLDLEHAGPMRVAFAAIAGGASLLIWTVHHFAIDEAGIDIALRELPRLLRGDALAPVHGSAYAFASIEEADVDAEAAAADARRLSSVLGGKCLPLPPPPRRGGEIELELDGALGQAVHRACTRWGVTPFTPISVAYGLALQRVFGDAWRFVLTPFSRRTDARLQEPIGYLLDLRLIEAGAQPGEDLDTTLSRVHLALLAAQRPSFAPLHRVAEALDGVDPALRAAATQFALTWRTQESSSLELDGRPASLLHVPQTGARFGLTLHVRSESGTLGARIEAVDEALADGRAAAVGAAFVQALSALCALPGMRLPELDTGTRPETPAAPGTGLSDALELFARRAWTQRIGAAPEGPQAHFLRNGGNSLLAMRLAADLQRDTGQSVDVASFLRHPTYEGLCAQLARQPAVPAGALTIVGTLDHEVLLLVLPGLRGSAASMFRLAQALHQRLPQSWAVGIVDLQAFMAQAPERGLADFLAQRLELLARGIGTARIGGIIGYSLGGLLAMDMLARLGQPPASKLPLWLVDTYAPHRMRRGGRARLAQVAVSLALHPFATLARIRERLLSRPIAPAGLDVQDRSPDGQAAQWGALLAELADRPAQSDGICATLIHSTLQARHAGLLRHRRTNGFDASRFASLRRIATPIDHEAMRGDQAPAVAQIIARNLLA